MHSIRCGWAWANLWTCVLDGQSGQFRHFTLNQEGSAGNHAITALASDSRGHIWAATQNGLLNRFEPAEGSVQHYALNRPDAGNLVDPEVGAAAGGPGRSIVAGGERGLAARFDLQEERYTWLPHGNTARGDDRPTALVRSPAGDFWMATAQAGLYYLDHQTERWALMTPQAGDPL